MMKLYGLGVIMGMPAAIGYKGETYILCHLFSCRNVQGLVVYLSVVLMGCVGPVCVAEIASGSHIIQFQQGPSTYSEIESVN